MQGTEQIIAVYQAGFIACLCLAVVFAALTIFIFFKLKIRQVFDFLTGREQRRTIKQMEQENAKTGKLREDTFIPGTTGDLYKTPSGSIPPVIYPVIGEMNTGTEPTQKTYYPSDAAGEGAEETTLLPNEGNEETTLLNENQGGLYGEPGETTVLTQTASGTEKSEERRKSGRFEIVKENMWIHTDEII